MKKTLYRTNIQSSTHANQLHVLLKTKELGGHQLEDVTTTVIIGRMKLINNNYSKLSMDQSSIATLTRVLAFSS